jgi:ParD-like antitoxin of type II ParDE toxin-antitoxin system
MNKRLEELLQRVAQWPPGAQEDAVLTLESIEGRVAEESKLSIEEREARLAELREMLCSSIERGGNHTPEDIDAMIDERFARSEP